MGLSHLWSASLKDKVDWGVLDLNTHNNAMLLKFLHKFFSRADIPWVNLIWAQYYNTGKLPGQYKKGSFWWRDIFVLLDKFKSFTTVKVADGASVLFWKDNWNGTTLALACPKLFSYARIANIIFKLVISRDDLLQNLHFPLSTQAYQQLLNLQEEIMSKEVI
jgi:hypothetical protein